MRVLYIVVMMLGVVVFVLGCITIGWTIAERFYG